jgi:uncharacterized protein YydD (DUF2326 family)
MVRSCLQQFSLDIPYYHITMNEDVLPAELPKDFDLQQYIVPTRLTDATEHGGLFGIRFG